MSARPTAVGVCGLGRCGTTMVMEMLRAGGLPPVDGSQPGSHEHLDLASVPADALDGRAAKLLDPHQNPWPGDETVRWLFIWLERDFREQARSGVKFLAHTMPGMVTTDRNTVRRFQRSLEEDAPRALRVLRSVVDQSGGAFMRIRFEYILIEPTDAAGAIARFLREWEPSFELDVEAMAAAVHRRGPECRPGLRFEVSGVGP